MKVHETTINACYELKMPTGSVAFSNLVETVCWHLKHHPERELLYFLADGEREAGKLTVADLDHKAREIAATLQAGGQQGQRALLVFHNGLDFITAFFGCLYAGVCAVPVYPPQNRDSYLQRLEAIAQDCQATFMLGTSEYFDKVTERLNAWPTLAATIKICVDNLPALATSYQPVPLRSVDLAFLQYTSGSTSAPKGVMVTHGNLLHNIAAMQHSFGHTHQDVIVSWLPMFHDMGLIGAVLQSICLGAKCITMSPATFLQRPARWLEAISKYRATTTFAPNFAYELCAQKVKPQDLAQLDLSSWSLALNGAEPIKPATLEAFAQTFASAGFQPNAMYPGYGLAEATLFVSGSPRLSGVRYLDIAVDDYESSMTVVPAKPGQRSLRVVSSGMPSPYHDVVIVDPVSGMLCGEGQVGEVWVHSASVGLGYWNNPQKTAETFHAVILGDSSHKHYMRTGDLGFLWQGHLFISGRIKELIIIRGQNHYPQNIEAAVQAGIPGLKTGGGAAFTVEENGEDMLVLVQECERTALKTLDPQQVFMQARSVVAEQFGLTLAQFVLIRPATLPKTSSGKIQRAKAKMQLLNGQLDLVSTHHKATQPATVAVVGGTATQASRELTDLTALLSMLVSQRAALPLSQIVATQAVTSYGLDSLAIAELTESISNFCGVPLTLVQMMEAQSLEEVASQILTLRNHHAKKPTPETASDAQPVSQEPWFALSLNQQQMLLIHQKQPLSSAYNVPVCLKGPFEPARLAAVLMELSGKFPVLHSRFAYFNDQQQWLQRAGEPEGIRLQHQLVAGCSEDSIRQRIRDASRQPFNIEQGEYARFTLFDDGATQQWLLLVFHHIAVDMLSVRLFVRSLVNLYYHQQHLHLVEQKSYRDFVCWQQELLESQPGQQSLQYWQDKLSGAESAIQWPLDKPRPEDPQWFGDSSEFAAAAVSTATVKACASQCGVTINSLLLAVYQLFLAKICNQQQFTIGTTLIGRPESAYAQTLGYFAEPAPFVTEQLSQVRFSELAKRTHSQMVDMLKHAGVALQAMLGSQHSGSFQTLFTFYPLQAGDLVPFNCDMAESAVAGAADLRLVPLPSPGAQLDLSLLVADDGEQLHFRFEYNSTLFTASQIAAFSRYFSHLLQQLVAQPHLSSHQLALQAEADHDHQQLLAGNCRHDFAESRTIHQMIASVATTYPDDVAVRDSGWSLTYGQLNQAANVLAEKIRSQVPRQSAIGVCAYRSFDMVVSLLAVLKAGCCYVPLDPELPAERSRYMAATADIALLLVENNEQVKTQLPVKLMRANGEQVPLLQLDSSLYDGESAVDPQEPVTDDDLAYIIFTSGSTGQPKGVMNTHGAIRNRLLWMRDEYGIDRATRILQKTPFTFDVSVWEFFLPLLAGGTLILAKPDGHKDPQYLAEYIRNERVSALHFVPSMLDAFLTDPNCYLNAQTQVFCSGEELSADLQRRFLTRFPGCQLHNLYGPTEAAVDVSYWHCQLQYSRVPIGRAIANIDLYVLDAEQQPVPQGITGELYIAGVGLARGYAGRPDLTAERFLPDPFAATAGARMYRTGDLVRYDEHGLIYYLGRIDSQVKIRGFRIELNEIDANLLQLPGIKEAVTLVFERNGDKSLVSYVVRAAETNAGDQQQIKAHLAATLPGYMVPAQIIFLSKMPVNTNGKLHRAALPAPELAVSQAEYQPPATDAERQLAVLWAQVLGVDVANIGRQQHFFQSGGHSLLAARLAANCQYQLNARLSVRDIFQYPLLSQQAAILVPSAEEQLQIESVERDGQPLPLSSAQLRLWFLTQHQNQASAYNMPTALEISGPLNTPALREAITQAVNHHEILRTRYIADDSDLPRMVIDPAAVFSIEQADWSALDEVHRDAARQQVMAQHAETPFRLDREWPIRVMLVKQRVDSHLLLVCLHHIAADGESLKLLLQQIHQGYVTGTVKHSSPALHYADFVAYQQRWLRSERQEKVLGYWKQQLAELPPPLALPTDKLRPAQPTGRGACLPVVVDAAVLLRLQHIAAATNTTLFMLVLTAFKLLLKHYTSAADICIGTPVSGRVLPAQQSIFGFFANTVVLRTQFAEDLLLGDFIAQLREMVLSAYEHQELPFQQLVDELQPERSLSHSPLFQVMFSLEHVAPLDGWLAADSTDQVRTRKLTRSHAIAKFDLSLMLEYCATNGLTGYFEYNTDLFEADTIGRFAAHLQALLQLLGDATHLQHTKLSEIPAVTAAEAKQLADWNAAEASAVCADLPQLFARQVQLYPDKTAVIDGSQQLSYHSLMQRAQALAATLQQSGVRPGDAVCLLLPPGISAVTAMLATLQVGAWYVPLDNQQPDASLRRLIGYVEPALLLCDSSAQCSWTGVVPVLDLANYHYETQTPRPVATGPEHLAYLMFTSGSTGEPKGVMVTHQAISRLVMAANYVRLNADSVMLQAAPLAFDASTFEIWGALLNGGTLVIYPSRIVEPDVLQQMCRQYQINTAWLTSSLFNHLIDLQIDCIDGLSQLLIGGDTVSAEHVQRVYQHNSEIQLINGYGPTESTTFAVCYQIPRDQIMTANGSVALGFAINGTSLYILDPQQKQLPLGAIGELYIGGAGLATGYFRRPELTEQRFVWLELPNRGPVRLYRTGDMVRQLADGKLEFIGRTDDQIKLRGFRFALKEVEQAIMQLDGVRQCAAIVTGEGAAKQLVAYVSGEQLDAAELLLQLRACSPGYMVPNHLQVLAQLPLTRNGKLDRKALPAVVIKSAQSPVAMTDNESLLAHLWAELLSVDVQHISRDSHFFMLGGHSLLAATLVAKCKANFSTGIAIKDVFDLPVLAELASRLGAVLPAPATVVRHSGTPCLSSAQTRMWFLSQLDPNSAVYNVPLTLQLTARDGIIEPAVVAQAVLAVVARHRILTTRYVAKDGTPQLVIDDAESSLLVETTACDHWTDSEREQWIAAFHAKAFDLSTELPVRAAVLRQSDTICWLLINIHHIATDGSSMQLLLNELAQAYNAGAHAATALPALAVQYEDYSVWQRRWLDSEQAAAQLTYWQRQLAGLTPKLDLPTDFARPAEQSFAGDCLAVTLPAEVVTALEHLCQQQNCSLYMVMLTAFNILLHKYSGETDLAIGSPVANRPLAELQPLIGFFANTLVLRTQLDPDAAVLTLLQAVKSVALDAYSQQDLPFELLVEKIQPERSVSYSPLFQVMLSVQHRVDSQTQFSQLDACLIQRAHRTAKFDLSFMLEQHSAGISGYIEFSTALFRTETIAAMWQHFISVLQQLPQALQRPVREIFLADQHMLLAAYRQLAPASIDYPELCLPQLFAAQVEKTPDAIAIQCGSSVLSYATLADQVRQVAACLRASGLQPKAACAVFLPRQADLLVCLLAIQQAGGYYVPLDPNYPLQRISDILASAQPDLLVSCAPLLPLLPSLSTTRVILTEEMTTSAVPASDGPEVQQRCTDIAYTIYTSGSTGKPKGIAISHQNAVAMLAWAQQQYSRAELSHVLAGTSICFDLSVFELFLPLTVGGCVHLVDDVLALLDLEDTAGLTLINTVPSAMEALVRLQKVPSSVRVVNLAGEPLSRKLVDSVYALGHVSKVYNLYGPSEDTTYSTVKWVSRNAGDKPAIGRTIANTQAYVLDDAMNLVPFGVAGELYLAGDGVTQGYLTDPEKTALAYLPDPFSSTSGQRLYKTGDRVRVLPDGDLDYLGRIDHQVKLRGYRIELSEIELLLQRLPTVSEVVALVNTSQAEQAVLVVYCSLTVLPDFAAQQRFIQDARQLYRANLPDYMQPAHIELLAAMPLLPNGKIDRKQLAARPFSRSDAEPDSPPATATEISLARIWCDLLQVGELSKRDNFFELGGHSLLATQLISRVQAECKTDLSIKQVFSYPTLAALAELIDVQRQTRMWAMANQTAADLDQQEEGVL